MSSSHPPVPPAAPPLARRRLALVILCAASLMVILDGTIVTVALPSIQADLGFTADSLSWVMTTYLIAFGGLLLLSGRLGDLLGRKRMFLAGIAVFVAASLACGLAAGPGMLIAARFVQGAGAAMASAVTLGMIVRLFDRPAEQGRAIGAFAFTGAVGASAGLIIGGLLVQYASWHWIFFVNLPVGVAAWLAAWRVLPADRGLGLRAGADWPGAGLVTGGVMLAVLAIAAPARLVDGPGRGRAAGGVRRAAGHRADAAAAAARPRLAQRHRRQPRPAAHHRRGDGLPGHRDPVPAARARLRPRGRRARVRTDRRRDRRRLARPVGAADGAVRRPPAAARRPGHDHGRARPADPGARARGLR